MNVPKPRDFAWPAIVSGLGQLDRDDPAILGRNVLVGGAACMFFRDQLEQIADPDFQVRSFRPEEEKYWLSHDADFATSNPEEIPDLAGKVPLGRLQVGFAVGAEEFRENARKIDLRLGDAQFSLLIADPLDLWREKESAFHRRAKPQDALHLEVLSLTLQWELVCYAEMVAGQKLSLGQWLERAQDVRRRFNAVFANESVEKRIRALQIREITEFAYPKSSAD